MELSGLTGKQISLKLKSQEKAMNCTVKYVVQSQQGIWVTGSPILEHVVKTGGGAPPMRQPMIFVFFESIEWLVADF